MADKVSLEALNTVHLENFLERDANDPNVITVRSDLNPRDIADIFRGSDVFYNTKDGTLMQTGGAPRSLIEEASWIEYIRSADTNHDGFLDTSEAYVAVKNAGLSEDEAKEADPQAFLKSVQDLIDVRYNRIAKNLNNHRAELLFQPMIDYLKMYSKGIYVDQVRHAEEVLPLNGLTKSGTNVVLVLPSVVHNIFTSDANDAPLMVGDAMAATHAFNEHNERIQSILRLQNGLDEAIRYGEKWALDGDFKVALVELTKTRKVKAKVNERSTVDGKEVVKVVEKEIELKPVLSSDDVRIISGQLVGTSFYDILTTSDEGERNRKLLDFSKNERPGFIGIGSGNSPRLWYEPWRADSNANFWNYTGSVNNLYASRGILSYLVSKAQVWRPFSGDVTEDMLKNGEIKKDDQGKLLKLDLQGTESLQDDARQVRLGILGDGGGFGNFLECHTPFLGIDCRTWGDEAKMGIPGRTLEIGLTAYLGYKSIKGIGNAWELGRLKGAGEPFRVWWKNARWYRPLALEALKDSRALALEEAAQAAQDGTALAKTPGRLGRGWSAMKKFAYDKTLGKLPVLSEAQKAQIAATAGKAPGRGIVFLTDATIVLGIVKRTDKKASAYFNPFELSYELDLSKKTDPTKPDPILSASPQKK